MSHPAEATEVAWSHFSSPPFPSPSFSSSGSLSQFSVSGQWSNKYCFVSLAQLWFHNPLCTLQLMMPCKFMAETSALRQNALQWKKENSHLLASLFTERRWAYSSPQFPQAVYVKDYFHLPWETPYPCIKMIHSTWTPYTHPGTGVNFLLLSAPQLSSSCFPGEWCLGCGSHLKQDCLRQAVKTAISPLFSCETYLLEVPKFRKP